MITALIVINFICSAPPLASTMPTQPIKDTVGLYSLQCILDRVQTTGSSLNTLIKFKISLQRKLFLLVID